MSNPKGKKDSSSDKGQVAQLAAIIVKKPPGIILRQFGARMRIWKQDPTVKPLGVRDVYIHTLVGSGPSDTQIQISGVPEVHPSFQRDFLFDPASADAFDAVHTYAVVRMVLTMYQRGLGSLINWQWNPDGSEAPIQVHPHAGEAMNAYYSRSGKSLKFFRFHPPGSGPEGPYVYTCRSFDIVAHETGHAILDGLRPTWLGSAEPQTGGLHESFGDLTSIFGTLSQLDLVEYIIVETKASLHRKNILASMAEQFGLAIGSSSGLRNADNDLKLSEVSNEVHEISQVFTGAVYDILADAFAAARDPRARDDAVVLYETACKVATIMVSAFMNAPESNPTFKNVAEKMIAIAQADPNLYPNYDTFIKNQFVRREVLGPNAVAGPQLAAGFGVSYRGCCGTMQNCW